MDKSQNELMLTNGRIFPLFRRYATPGVITMLFIAFQAIVDGFIVGRLIGADALAAVNIVAPTFALITAVALIIGVGTQAQMGIYLGGGDHGGAKVTLRSGMTGLSVFAVLATILANTFDKELALLLGASTALLELSVRYIQGLMPLLVGIGFLAFFDYVLKALGHPRIAMVIMICTILTNITLSFVFVGLLDMSTFGVGLGTGVSFAAGGIVSGTIVWRQVRLSAELSRVRSRFSMRVLRQIFYNGSSEGLAEIAMGITLFLFNITLMKYVGEAGVAAFTIVSYVIFIGTSFLFGVSNGIIPILSYNFGAGKLHRVAETVRLAVITNLVLGIFFLIFLWFAGESIVHLFIAGSETEVLALATRGARLISLAFLFNGFNIFVASYFTAIDKPLLSLIVASLRGLIILGIGIFALPYLIGEDGIWLTILVAEAFTFVPALFLLYKDMKKQEK